MMTIFLDAEQRWRYGLVEPTEPDIWILESLKVIPLDDAAMDRLAQAYSDKKWISYEESIKLFPSDTSHAAALLQNGQVDGVVTWSVASTADVIRVGYNTLWLAPDRRISGEFLMFPSEISPQQDIYIIGDAAVNPDPTQEQIVSIADSLLETHRAFFPDTAPRVAFLSFSTHESGIGASVDKMRWAARDFRVKYPDIESDGPIQFDAAIDMSVYMDKTKGKAIFTQKPNILIFPNLDAGNMVYKSMERFGGYSAIWPILTVFSSSGWSDLSRGTSIETIVDMVYVTALRARSGSHTRSSL